MQEKILIVEDDPVAIKLVKAILLNNNYLVGEANNGKEAISIIHTFKPDLVLMDVLMPVMNGFEACRQIREDPAISSVPIIMLTALTELEQKIKGFEAGADDYISKPFEQDELLVRIAASMRRSQVQPTTEFYDVQGKIIAVFSLRGGAGVSTIAANTATALTEIWDKKAVLVDMNMIAGQSALFLNVPLKNSWADIAKYPIDEIDIQFLDNVLIEHEGGTKVLAAPHRPEAGELITGETITYILGLLRKQYHYIVLDLSHDFYETTLAALDLTDEIILVTPPEIAGVRLTMTALQTFEDLGYPANTINVISNWIFDQYGLSEEQIEKAIKRKINLVIPYATKYMLPALNYGIPTVLKDPLSPIGALFEDLAFAMSKAEHNKQLPKNPTDAWKRVAMRIKKRKKKLGKMG